MIDAKEHIHKLGNNIIWTIGFCLNSCKWELPDLYIDMSNGITKLVYIAKFLISEPDSCWVPILWLLWSDQHIYTYCFRCVVYNVMRSSICATYLQECPKSSWAISTRRLNDIILYKLIFCNQYTWLRVFKFKEITICECSSLTQAHGRVPW